MNTHGTLFRVTTWGESHGKAIGAVIDGCPANLPLEEGEIRDALRRCDRPIPELATSRDEPNEARILSGTWRGRTLGTPICIVVPNVDAESRDYAPLSGVFRPGHGDFSYHAKYGTDPLPGGGRASGRQCIARLAAGCIADKLLRAVLPAVTIGARIVELAGMAVEDRGSLQRAVDKAARLRDLGDSSGGIVEVVADGLPAGLGEPVFGGLDAALASALMGIGAVKSVEIGAGAACASLAGSRFNDGFCAARDRPGFSSNRAGGVLAGIGTGAPIVARIAVKPTPSIAAPQMGATVDGELREIRVRGRHDASVTPRVAPIAAAMTALVLVDLLMIAGRIPRERLP
jgi:chorismate synthase